MERNREFILGAGITGLSIGYNLKWPIFEAEQSPGGICSSYYIRPGENHRLTRPPSDEEAYRFETGGGHWIFGADDKVLDFIKQFTRVKDYFRNSQVYFSKKKLFTPYPLQNNLHCIDKKIADKALREIPKEPVEQASTLKEWLSKTFGKTLCELFFYPFHSLYTADLYEQLAPQDNYKTPVNKSVILRGAQRENASAGYNNTFIYPVGGLNTLVQCLADHCKIYYGRRIVKIDVGNKIIYFSDGESLRFATLISTLPLNKAIEMSELKVNSEPDPYISVLVLNIGAIRGNNCPSAHWLYIPDSNSGFYRLGFYNNVDISFLPKSAQGDNSRVNIYVEKAYPGGKKPSQKRIKVYTESVIKELKEWGFIKTTEVVDATWIDVAYTWSWPSSKWRDEALQTLKGHQIHQIGRYGRWHFQGIADSIKEGLFWAGTIT